MKCYPKVVILVSFLFLSLGKMEAREAKVHDLAPQSPVTAKVEETKIIGTVSSPDLILKASQVGTTSSVVLSLENIGENSMPYLYEDPRAFGFRCRVYDAEKNPVDVIGDGSILAYPDGRPRLGGSRFAQLGSTDTLAIQIDLAKFFKIPPQRPTEIYLSVWWYTRPGASVEPYPYIQGSIWRKIILK